MKTYYFVATKDHGRVSRVINNLGVLRRVLKRVRRYMPEAYGIKETFFR